MNKINSELLNKALQIIEKENNPSISLLQVRLNLTLEEATQIMDLFVKHGIISDYKNAIPKIINTNIVFKDPSEQNNSKQTPSNNFSFDSLDGHSFEYFCADLLRYNGYTNVQVTSGSGDFGVDILCKKNNKTYAIQCKCYSNNVSNKAVQEVVSGRIFYKCTNAVVMTNSYFTAAAEETARLTDVELWDRGRINELLRIAKQNGYTTQKY